MIKNLFSIYYNRQISNATTIDRTNYLDQYICYKIAPQTMKEVIPKLTQALAQTNLTHSQNEQIL